MALLERINVGIVGAVGRGGAFRHAFEAGGARIHAVCDTNADELATCASRLGASEKYVDFQAMLEKSELDVVVIATPMHLHVPQSIAALEAGLHVLCEVPAAVSVDECRRLELATRRSKGVYMMGENYCYWKECLLVRELVGHGLFGQTYYAEGEYLHELKELFERTTWRRHWQVGIDGVTYGTHSLGPTLQWMPGDRVTRVACEGSGHHYRDPRGNEYAQDTPVMLAKMQSGALVKIRTDIISDRPGATNYQIQGTDGVCEFSRGSPHNRGRIRLRALDPELRWQEFDGLLRGELGEKYLPARFRRHHAAAEGTGHGGGDYLEVMDFLEAIRGNPSSAIGIHEALDMTLPGLISQESIRCGGEFRAVPNSRDWASGEPLRQLRMLWPAQLASRKPVVELSREYELRQYRESDESDYIALMTKAGFTGWSHDTVENARRAILPGGFFVIEHRASGQIVATACAMHRPAPDLPYSGELSWVAADPEHKGRGLGLAASSAVVNRLLDAGYRSIYLLTDDHRLPAIHVYLELGFEPDLPDESATDRWRALRERLYGSRKD